MFNDEMSRQREESSVLFSDIASFIVFNQIYGDVLEFGVYKGDSLIDIDKWLNKHWLEFRSIGDLQNIKIRYDEDYLASKRFFAFDSFMGLPFSKDPDKPIHFVEGAYAASEEDLLCNLKKHGFDISKLVVSKGWYHQTLTTSFKSTNELRKASLIYIDCDLRESAIPVFNFISDLIQDGTVILIDDFFRYNGHPLKGVRGAFNEWKQNTPNIVVTELSRCCGNRVAFVCNSR